VKSITLDLLWIVGMLVVAQYAFVTSGKKKAAAPAALAKPALAAAAKPAVVPVALAR
jgi:hypothetical protein